MIVPSVGTTCAFVFTSRFTILDGVYKVRAEVTFTNAISSGVDFVENLYTPVGLSSGDFSTDYASYTKDRVLVLEAVADSTKVFYIPESLFAKVPDPTIKEYYSLIMVVNLGVHKNTQVVIPLIDSIKDTVQASLGVTDPVYVATNPDNKVYLTDTQYQALVVAREANVQQLVPLSVQLKQEQDRNTILATKVAYYENLIAQSHA
jgi:hypothetical protein